MFVFLSFSVVLSRLFEQSNPLALPLKNPRDGASFGNVFRQHLGCQGKPREVEKEERAAEEERC